MGPDGNKILVVAEKPSVAKRINFVLSKALKADSTKARGKSKYNPVYRIRLAEKEVTVTSVSGFIKSLDFEPPFQLGQKWALAGESEGKKWTLEKMVDTAMRWKVEGKGNYLTTNKQIIQQIKDLAKVSDIFVAATDNDFAGELIGYQAYSVALEARPDIRLLRMIFSSVAYGDIVDAWNNLTEMRLRHKDAEVVRQKSDLMTGALFTRLLTLLVQQKLPGVLITWGGCQILFLRFIVDKYVEHSTFEPRTFWEIVATVQRDEKEHEFRWEKGKVFNRKEAKLCLIETRDKKKGTVVEVKKAQWKKSPPVPLRTATFLQKLGKISGLSSKVLMDNAEELYNKGFISYPRTENEVHPPTFNARRILETFRTHEHFGPYVTALLNESKAFIRPRRGRHKTEDHDPIYPVRAASRSEIETGVSSRFAKHSWLVYDFVSRHFIATCSKGAVFDKTDIRIEIGEHIFEASGKVKVSGGFMDIYPFYRPKTGQVPACQEGDVLDVSYVEMREGLTQPPPLPSEADIIKWASDNGIGTDATFHLHLETVQRRKYAEKTPEKKLIPTSLGIALCSSLEKHSSVMVDIALRRDLQEKVDSVASGSTEPEEVIQAFRAFARDSYEQLSANSREVTDALASVLLQEYSSGQDLGRCGKCGGSMHLELRHSYGGKVSRYAACPECESSFPLPKGGKLVPLEGECQKCGFTVLRVKDYVICPKCFTSELDKKLFTCSRCQRDCKFSGTFIDPSQAVAEKKVGKCPECGGEVFACFGPEKRFAKCSRADCSFLVRLPRASKGDVAISTNICPRCGTSLFEYRKKHPKGKNGKTVYFCIACAKGGGYTWCFSCGSDCKGGIEPREI